jgi:uroporphyrin-III C-methyltransferase
MSMAGKVWLVGAGPGDPELLTLRALRALAAADVVLVDDLVGPAILAHARPGARVVEVGKRGGCASTPQAFIERLMVSEALAGRQVVRLKGGDPFVFGRGGEELAAARAAGLEVEVVPGITSGFAAARALEAPLTHRDDCHGVAFVTGHARPGAEPDWGSLARSGLTLVIYMAMARLETIATELQRHGLAGDTPAAVVQSASLPAQREIVTTLRDLPSAVREAGLGSPAIVIVGKAMARAALAGLALERARAAGR